MDRRPLKLLEEISDTSSFSSLVEREFTYLTIYFVLVRSSIFFLPDRPASPASNGILKWVDPTPDTFLKAGQLF